MSPTCLRAHGQVRPYKNFSSLPGHVTGSGPLSQGEASRRCFTPWHNFSGMLYSNVTIKIIGLRNCHVGTT
jgi:hypothetical protein